MLKTLQTIKGLPHVAFVDNERRQGNSIIVTFADGWCFADDPGCGVKGFDTVAEATAGTRKSAVEKAKPRP